MWPAWSIHPGIAPNGRQGGPGIGFEVIIVGDFEDQANLRAFADLSDAIVTIDLRRSETFFEISEILGIGIDESHRHDLSLVENAGSREDPGRRPVAHLRKPGRPEVLVGLSLAQLPRQNDSQHVPPSIGMNSGNHRIYPAPAP